MTDILLQRQVWLVEFPGSEGHEAAGKRPALIVQCDGINRSRWQTIVVIPLTTKLHRAATPGATVLPRGAANLPERSVAVGLWITAIDRSRFRAPIGVLSRAKFREVLDSLGSVLAEEP